MTILSGIAAVKKTKARRMQNRQSPRIERQRLIPACLNKVGDNIPDASHIAAPVPRP